MYRVNTKTCQRENVSVADYCKNRLGATENKQLFFLAEVGNHCPLCGRYLLKQTSHSVTKLYEIAHIFPKSPIPTDEELLNEVEVLGATSEDSDNKIALCKDCHTEYDNHKTLDSYNKLLNIKKEKLAKLQIDIALSKHSIEEEVAIVIDKLCNLDIKTLDTLRSLNYNALEIREKINNKQSALIHNIEQNVTKYFLFIKEEFVSVSNSSTVNLRTISASMRHAYEQSKARSLDEQTIFESLVLWISDQCQCQTYVANIIVSFFIQNCDVFDKISK